MLAACADPPTLPAISYHTDLNMDTVVTAVRNLFSYVTNSTPRYKVHGGTQTENLALQNIQVCQCLTVGKVFVDV
jgi:NAD+ synthase (glutamine-hydrolysing)